MRRECQIEAPPAVGQRRRRAAFAKVCVFLPRLPPKSTLPAPRRPAASQSAPRAQVSRRRSSKRRSGGVADGVDGRLSRLFQNGHHRRDKGDDKAQKKNTHRHPDGKIEHRDADEEEIGKDLVDGVRKPDGRGDGDGDAHERQKKTLAEEDAAHIRTARPQRPQNAHLPALGFDGEVDELEGR